MRHYTKILTGVLACLLVSAGPVLAQVGVLDQPYRNDPFQPLLEGRWSITGFTDLGASNNTLGVGDVMSVMILTDSSQTPDFGVGDMFLIAGLIPAGEGVTVASQNRMAAALTFPVGKYVTLGLNGGARLFAEAVVPDDISKLVRDGIEGEEINVNLTDLGGETFAYGEAGLSALANIPLLPTPFGRLHLLAGAGARYIHGITHMRIGFAGDEGEGVSTFTMGRNGVSGEFNITRPLMDTLDASYPLPPAEAFGGTGTAFDVMAGAAIGHMAQVRLAITDMGSATVNTGPRTLSTVVLEDRSLVEFAQMFGDSTPEWVDSVSTTQELPADEREITLPTTFRMDASIRPLDLIGFGLRIAAPMTDRPAYEPMVQAATELRLIRFLPLRAGVTGGGQFNTGYFGGIGIDSRVLRWDMEVASSGGPQVADLSGISFRTSMSIRF